MEQMQKDIDDLYTLVDGLSGKLLEFIALSGAMRRCLTVLIASHPQPGRMRIEWQRRLDEWVNDEMADGSMESPDYGPTTRTLLAHLSQEIDVAAARRPGA